MLLSTTTPLTATDHYLLTRLLAITHLHFTSTPANLSLVPWYRIRAERKERKSKRTTSRED